MMVWYDLILIFFDKKWVLKKIDRTKYVIFAPKKLFLIFIAKIR